MRRIRRTIFLRYGVAVSAVAVALLLKLLLNQLIVQDTPFLLVFAAIMVSAWYGGLGPGLLATVLAALTIDYFFLPLRGSFSGFGLEATPLVVFFLEGALISLLTAVYSTARERARQDELRQGEERFRLLVEGVKDYAIFMLDPGGHVVSWNTGAKRIKGYREEEIIGEHFSRFYTEEDLERGLPQENLRVATTEGHYEEEGLRVRKDGTRFWANVVITAIRDEQGNLRGFSKVTRDITERKRSEEELQHVLDRLIALYESSQLLGSTLKREEIVSRLLEVMQHILSLTTAVISTPHEDGSVRIWRSVGLERLWQKARYTPEAVEARRASLETEEPQIFLLQPPDFETEPLAGLCLSLRTQERNLGLLEVYGPESLAESDMVNIFESLAGQAASALQNAQLYEELAEHERQLHDLVGRMLVAQEEERRRVAYEVHDGLAQVAAAAHQRLQTFAKRHPPDSTQGQKRLARALELIQQTVVEARRVIADLRPTALDDFGLATALRLHVEGISSEDWQVSYEDKLGHERLPVEVETVLYRVAQEALTNARKHAQSSRIHLRLERLEDRNVRLEVRDWGRGFEPGEMIAGGGPGERVGISSMEERITLVGGSFEIRSQQGVGTSVVAEVALPDEEDTGNHER